MRERRTSWFPGRLDGSIIFAIPLFLLALAVAARQSASTPDCSRAKGTVEKAICATPELTAADAAMARAYAALKAALPADQQQGLLADQRQWIGIRDGRCTDAASDALTRCLLTETERRRRFLAGKGLDGPADPRRLQPAFFRETRKGRYEIAVAYPRITGGSDAAEMSFNKTARGLVVGADVLKEYRTMDPPFVKGVSNSYDVSYDVTYLSPRLASIVFTIFTYTGGAHPNTVRTSLVFDLEHDHAVTLADLLTAPARAVPTLSAQCLQHLRQQASQQGWELFDNADPAETVGDVRKWAPSADGVEILFDPYSIAAYAFGAHECQLAWADLSPWLKPSGPLPPQ